MNLEKSLKNLKHIEANKDYKEKSRLLILSATPANRGTQIFDIILKNIEVAAAYGLAGVLIFLIFGGFSAWKFLEPLNVSGLDPTALHAEANAIDMQIELTNLNYGLPQATAPVAESTPSTPSTSAASPKAAALAPLNTPSEAADNSTSSPYVPVDDVLQTLGN